MTNTLCTIRRLIIATMTLLLLAADDRATGGERVPDRRALYNTAVAAAVEVLANGRLEASGWFADSDGHVVTVAHLLTKHEQELVVRSKTLGRMPAKLVAVDVGHDLALLRAKLPAGAKIRPLTIADAQPGPGADVFLFGAALFRHWLMLRGMIARDTPTFEYYGNLGGYSRVIHVSAPSPPGTSGGCWLNADGQVVGGQSGMMSVGGGGSGIAFMTPAAAIRRLVRTRESATTPTIGSAIEELCEQSAKHIRRFPPGAEGVLAVKSTENSPAQRADLSRDRLIQAVDGRPVRYRHEFLDAVRSRAPGDEITLTVIAADSETASPIQVTLGALTIGREQ